MAGTRSDSPVSQNSTGTLQDRTDCKVRNRREQRALPPCSGFRREETTNVFGDFGTIGIWAFDPCGEIKMVGLRRFALALSLSAVVAPASAGELRVRIEGMRAASGAVLVGIFDTASSF